MILPLWLAIIVFLVAIAITIKCGDLFTDGAKGIGLALGVSNIVMGLTLVSFATTSPEFMVSVMSSASGNSGLAVGNAVGSCICNIGLILAILGIMKTVPTTRNVVSQDGVVLVIMGATLFGLSLDRTISRIDGAILVVLFLAYMFFIIRRFRQAKPKYEDGAPHRIFPQETEARKNLKKNVILFLVGAAGVVGGSRLLIISGESMARAFGVPDVIIGLTLIAVGTSLPELVTAIMSVRKGLGDMGVGNVIGANIWDTAWVVGVSALARPLPIDDQTISLTFPVMLGITVLTLVLLRYRYEWKRWKGAIILGCYVAYLVALLFLWPMISA
ncbi:MAG: sodium:proton exchanger [Thermoplasmata archaeon HGW-Thermoplasmata-1]|nr:MAG: sodium:proton exchanger [Thermoplasmata archaeon HGW-Thermoplasmata-1]